MSADVQNHTTSSSWMTTTTSSRSWTRTQTSAELSTTSSTPLSSSSSSTIASLSSTPLLSTPLLPPAAPSSPPSPSSSIGSPTSTSTSISSTISMTTGSSVVPSTTVPTAIIPTMSTPTTTPTTTTTSTTITPTTIITTTTTISTPITPTSSSTSIPTSIIPTSTTTTTVIPPTSSVGPITSTSSITPSTSTTSTTSPGTTSTTVTTAIPVVSTPRTGSSSITPTPEAMLTPPTPIAPMSTFSTTVFIPTTDVRGSTTFYAPPIVTTLTMVMGPSGSPTTSMTVVANPTLNPDNSSPSSFFSNKGAVAGVFTLVGLAIISITFWIIFFIRRRRREMRFEHDTAVFASLDAAGFNRTPLENEYDSSVSSHRSRYGSGEFLATPMATSNPERHRRSTSGLPQNNNGRLSILPDAYHEDRGQYDPYIRNSRDGYHDIPSPTTPHLNIPPPSAFAPYRDRSPSDGMGMVEVGTGLPMVGARIAHPRHSHQSSSGSLEPLLALYHGRNGPSMPGYGPPATPTVANKPSNGRASRTSSTENGSSISTIKQSSSQAQPNSYATNTSSRSALLANGREGQGSEVNFVHGAVEQQKQDGDLLGDADMSTAEDERESQKPVLAVRNLPDAVSTLSLA